MSGVMWRPDPLQEQERKLESHRDLHRLAGQRGFWCMPKLSSINKRYYAEINRNENNDDGSYKWTYYNVKMGTGDTPLEAAADGYKQAMPDDPEIALAVIEARLDALMPQLARHAQGRRNYLAVTGALDSLTESLFMVKTGLTDVAALRSKPATPIITDEDDDL